MIYSVSIDTDKNKYYKSSPKRTILKVTSGLVYKVEIDFPPGSAGLMGVCIFDGGYQVWPSSLGEWFTGDDIQIIFDDTYLKESAPYQFDVFTYNDDTEHGHLLNLRIGFVSRDIFMARFLPHLTYKYFEETLRTLFTEQTALAAEQKQSIITSPFPWLKEQAGVE